MKKLLISLIIVLLTSPLLFGQITSTTSGGNWSETSTWLGGVVPTTTDNVIIDGDVYVDDYSSKCRNILIKDGKKILALSRFAKLEVAGNIINYGNISENNYKDFDVKIKGDMTNNGEWSCSTIRMEGTTDQTISGTSTITCDYFTIPNGNRMVAGSDLNINVKQLFRTYNSEFIVNEGKTVSFSNTGKITYCHFSGGGTVSADNSFGFSDSTSFKNITLDGIIQTEGIIIINENVKLSGTLQSKDNDGYVDVVVIVEDFTNNGTIQDNGSENLYITFKGSKLTNNGVWSNYKTSFKGTSEQTLFGTAPYSTKKIYVENGQKIIAGSDLIFDGCKVYFNNSQFIIGEGKTVSLSHGTLRNAHLDGGGTLYSGVSFGFSDSTSIKNIKLDGIINDYGIITIKENVELLGVIQALEFPHQINIEKDFINNGTIHGMLHVFITTGNLTNNKIWRAFTTYLEGTTDQTFTNKDSLSGNFSLKANVASASTYQWYKDGVAISGATDENYYINQNTSPYGEYYCQTNAGNSRKITIAKETAVNKKTTLTGKVTNAVDGTAISGALVEIAGLSTTTDFEGNYEITNIPAATLNAAFSAVPLNGNAPLHVNFTDQSSDAASYTLMVSAVNYSIYTNNQVVIAPGDTLAMDVSLSPVTNKQINDWQQSTQAITSWKWNFGDGTTSTEKNPTHTYNSKGTYTVTLTVSDGTNNDIETKMNYIYVTGSVSGDTIYSTTAGGNWEDSLTWIGHKVPSSNDNVVIQGTVIANAHYGDDFECKSLTLRDSLKCTNDGNYHYVTLTIHEDLNNNGTITYSDGGYGLTIFVKGNITNNGIFEPNLIRLNGNSPQTISGTAPIQIHYFEILNGQDIIAGSDLNFVDVSGFNTDSYGGMKRHVNFIIPKDMAVSFIWKSNEMSSDINKVNFQGGGTIFAEGNVRFIDSTTFSNVKLAGLIQLNDNARILDNVTLLDTLQNASNNYGALIVIEEDFTNNGIVRENANSNNAFYIYAKKNIVNVGTWKNSYVCMNGTTNQTFINKGELTSSFELKANVNNATTFQWYKDGVAINGATSELYSIYNNQSTPFDSYGEYYCQTNNGNSRKITIKKENNSPDPIILAENFDGTEFLPNGWSQKMTITDHTWQQGNPGGSPFTDIDPTNVFSAICPYTASNQDEWLKSPVISLSNDALIALNFYAGYSTAWLTNATLKLHISTDGGTNWTQLWEAVNDSTDWKWHKITVDLSNYKNSSNVMLAWQYVGNDGDLVGIDNVHLSYGTAVEEKQTVEIPTEFALNQNYPNPFNPTTVISYALPKQEYVSLSIYNILGEKIAELVNEVQNAGIYKVNFNADNFASGAYIYRITAGNFTQTKKMLLLK